MHPDDIPSVRERFSRATREGGLYEVEVRYRRHDGAYRWFSVRSAPHKDSDGRVLRWLGTSTDIDDLKQALGRLENERAMLQSILDHLPAAFYIKAKDGRLLVANRQFADLAGRPSEEIVGLSDAEVFPDADLAEIRRNDDAVLSGSEPLYLEEVLHLADGPRTYISIKGAIDHVSLGGRVVIGFSTDVTARKQAEEETRASSARLALALEHARLGDWSWTRETDRVRLSPRAAEIFGLSVDALLTPADIVGIMNPEDRARDRIKIARTFEHGEDYEMEYRITRPTDGAEVWISAKARAEYDREGTVTGMLGLVQDITERKHAEQEREDLLASERFARSEAERASRMKDEFLATLSHELRTPLNAIQGFTAFALRRTDLDEEMAECLAAIDRNTRSQTQLVEDLLDMNRIVTGKIRLEKQEIDMAAVVQTALDSVRPMASAKPVSVRHSVDPSARRVTGDPARLQQIIWNLLSNSIKFTPPNGSVTVCVRECTEDDNAVEVIITDTGSGIAPDFLPHIFERFRQADSSSTRRHGGLGLGLAIVRNLTEMHGGTVSAESEGLGKGSTFRVRLPRSAAPPGTPMDGEESVRTGHPTAWHDIDLRGFRVLAVDDQPDGRDLIRRIVTEAGAEIVAVESASDALSALSQKSFDVLISDIALPDMDGIELIRRIRAGKPGVPAGIPAIAVTAFARPEDRERMLRNGFDHFLPKPMSPDALRVLLAKIKTGLPS